jgi:hypothetical protein
MRITSSGSVGIGTSAPATTLDVNGASTFRGAMNLAGNVITNWANQHDAYSPVYVIVPAAGTATVSRTFSDVYYREFALLLTNETVLKIDTSTFPTNGGATIAWQVNPNGQTISADYSTIDSNSWAALSLTTNAYNDLIFRKAPYATTFKVQGE